jgi:potassium-transporting ATPase KdpC subunit
MVKLFLWMTFVTGVIYPLLITAIAQLTMSAQANGSFVEKRGSALIAQNFQGERFFWPRPSAIHYNPLPSGGSNLSPTSALLKQMVEERKKRWGQEAPLELLFSSGSGLDPHISLETAYFQMERIAKARGMEPKKVKEVIDSQIIYPLFGFLGSPHVNVLLLNIALEAHGT